jgi:hypothetical protein
MQVSPQAFPTVQILQHIWDWSASFVECNHAGVDGAGASTARGAKLCTTFAAFGAAMTNTDATRTARMRRIYDSIRWNCEVMLARQLPQGRLALIDGLAHGSGKIRADRQVLARKNIAIHIVCDEPMRDAAFVRR